MEIAGLSSVQASELKSKFGDNLIPQKEKNTCFSILFSQFANPLVLVLFVVGVLSFVFGENLDAFLIAFVIVFNLITGFAQEYSAQKTLAELTKIIKSRCVAIRDGQRQEIDTKDLVPGDIVVVSSGDKIPADGQVVGGGEILVNEAIITGEEEAVTKNTNPESNPVYMGTSVLAGQVLMRVEKIGKETKVGIIGKSLAEIKDEPTPLQKHLQKLTRSLITIVIGMSIFIFILGMARGGETWLTLRSSVVLSVAALPEGLLIAVTVILAIGARRILRQKGLIKKLLSIETLGSTSVICMDKTGTLTEGNMKVVNTDFTDKDNSILALTLLNDRKAAMEIAIWNYLESLKGEDANEVFKSHERLSDVPFDSANKYKSVVCRVNGQVVTYIMGAPDVLFNFCNESAITEKDLKTKFDSWAEKGLRVLAVAQKFGDGKVTKSDFEWLGLVGIEDPVRAEAEALLNEAASAGIEIKIVTGDYEKTALVVAKKVGMTIGPENVMNADILEKITDNELSERIDKIKLFARVTPMQKLRIVSLLQAKGEIVAMTGDGVNDAPALKKADIGIVVENGTDVAKEAADLILLDSNFKTIILACEEGRTIFANIKKVVGYSLSNSFAQIILILGSMLLNLPSPILVAQILWIYLICDGPPDIMLGFEPKEDGIMEITPDDIKKDSILSGGMRLMIFIVSSLIGLVGLGMFWYYSQVVGDLELARTMVFALFAIISVIYIFAFKNLKQFVFDPKVLFNNSYLNASVIYGWILVFLGVYAPFLNKILGTEPLSFIHWVIIICISLFVTLVIEVLKVTVIKSRV